MKTVLAMNKKIKGIFRSHWGIILILLSFLGSAVIVPIMVDVPISDDWIYARSVEIFLSSGRLEILNISVASLVFQVLWGSVFAKILGYSFGILRVSTFALVLISGLYFYLLLEKFNIKKELATLGTAIYLFNPLTYSLSFTFMTDMHFTSIMVIASYYYLVGIKNGIININTLFAAFLSGLLFLIRQMGVIFSLSILSYLILVKEIRLSRDGLRKLIYTIGPTIVIIGGYYYWVVNIHGIPKWQTGYFDVLLQMDILSWVIFYLRFFPVAIIYLSIFILPLLIPMFLAISTWQKGKLTKITLFSVVLFMLSWLLITLTGMRMPYLPHFLNRAGLGPNDLIVSIPTLMQAKYLIWPSLFLLITSIVMIVFLINPYTIKKVQKDNSLLMIFIILLGQIVVAIPPSLVFRNFQIDGYATPGLDRYLLPVIPLMIIFTINLLNDEPINLRLSWIVLILVALFSIAGTRDLLVLHEKNWDLARKANNLGIPNLLLDGGATWDGYNTYQPESDIGATPRANFEEIQVEEPNKHIIATSLPWWFYVWAPEIDPEYIISGAKIMNYLVLDTTEYYSWLRRDEVELYLLRR